MVLAIDFLAVVDEWRSSPLDFVWTKVHVQACLLRSLVRKYASWQRCPKFDSLPDMNFFLQVYGSQSSIKSQSLSIVPRGSVPR